MDGPRASAAQPDRVPHGGKGAAVRAGMLAVTTDLGLFSDADMATPPDQIPLLVAALDDSDVALGSRIQPDGRDMRGTQPFYRRMLGKAFHLFASFWVVGKVQDTQCGFKGFTPRRRARPVRRQKITSIVFDVELIYLARRRGYSHRDRADPLVRQARVADAPRVQARGAGRLGPAAHPAHPPGWSPRTRDQPVPTRSMIGSRPGDRPWLVPVVATALVIVSFFIFLLSARTFDAGRPDLFYLADAFLHGRVTIPPLGPWDVVPAAGGQVYVPFGPFPSIVMVPLVWIIGPLQADRGNPSSTP